MSICIQHEWTGHRIRHKVGGVIKYRTVGDKHLGCKGSAHVVFVVTPMVFSLSRIKRVSNYTDPAVLPNGLTAFEA